MATFSLKSVNKRLHPFNIRLETVKTDNVQEINITKFIFEIGAGGLVIFAGSIDIYM